MQAVPYGVSSQLSFCLLAPEPSKLVAAAPPCGDIGDKESIEDPPPAHQAANDLLETPVSTQYNHSVSPASTESLLGRTMEKLLYTLMIITPSARQAHKMLRLCLKATTLTWLSY